MYAPFVRVISARRPSSTCAGCSRTRGARRFGRWRARNPDTPVNLRRPAPRAGPRAGLASARQLGWREAERRPLTSPSARSRSGPPTAPTANTSACGASAGRIARARQRPGRAWASVARAGYWRSLPFINRSGHGRDRPRAHNPPPQLGRLRDRMRGPTTRGNTTLPKKPRTGQPQPDQPLPNQRELKTALARWHRHCPTSQRTPPP
jgi:hypothetical protein